MLAGVRPKLVLLVAVFLSLIAAAADEASAQSRPGPALQVCVTASHGRPIAGAVVTVSVFAEPSTTRRSLTDATGCTTFSQVPVGYLSVSVAKNGFDTAKQNVRIAVGMEGALVGVSLTPLAVIANVRSSASVRYKYYSPESRFAPLFRDLIEQMNALGGANIRVSPSGGIADVSLDGADPSLTSTTFDGVQVQSASAFDTIDVDALTKASTDLSDGSLGLYTLSPTPVLQRDWRVTYGGTSDVHPDLQESDTAGNLGYALQIAGNTLRSPLDGQTFSDSSGFTYKHTGRFLGGMTGAALDVPLGQNFSAGAKYLRRISRTEPLEVIDSGSEPEGYGPYPVAATDDGSIFEARLDGQVGGWETRLQYENFASHGTTDLTRAYADGVPAPSDGFSASDEGDAVLFAERPTVHNQTLNLNLTFSHSADRMVNRFESSANGMTIVSSRRSFNADYNGFFGKRSFYEFSGTFDRDNATGQNASRLKSYVRLQTGKTTTLFASLAGGSQLGLVPNAGVFALPSQVQYDCQSQTAIATAPNDKPSVPTGLEMRVGVTKSSGRSSLSIQAYERRYQGVTLTSVGWPRFRGHVVYAA